MRLAGVRRRMEHTVRVMDFLSSGTKLEVQLNGPTTDQKIVESKVLAIRPFTGLTMAS